MMHAALICRTLAGASKLISLCVRRARALLMCCQTLDGVANAKLCESAPDAAAAHTECNFDQLGRLARSLATGRLGLLCG